MDSTGNEKYRGKLHFAHAINTIMNILVIVSPFMKIGKILSMIMYFLSLAINFILFLYTFGNADDEIKKNYENFKGIYITFIIILIASFFVFPVNKHFIYIFILICSIFLWIMHSDMVKEKYI